MRDAKLSESEIAAALATLRGWSRKGDVLTRTLRFASFMQAIEAVRRIAEAAEAADHHPDIDIRYRELTFGLTTHDSGGLTRRDVDVARAIDAVSAQLGAEPVAR